MKIRILAASPQEGSPALRSVGTAPGAPALGARVTSVGTSDSEGLRGFRASPAGLGASLQPQQLVSVP